MSISQYSTPYDDDDDSSQMGHRATSPQESRKYHRLTKNDEYELAKDSIDDDDIGMVRDGLPEGVDEAEVIKNTREMRALARQMTKDYGEDCPPEWQLGPEEGEEKDGEDDEKVPEVSTPKLSSVGRTQREVGLAYAADLKKRAMGKTSALPSGFATITKHFPALFSPGHLVLLAARPGMGKTVLANQIAENIGQKELSLFISLEMSSEELVERSISSRTGVTLGQLQTPDVSPAEIAAVDILVGGFICSLNYKDRIPDFTEIEKAIRTHAADGGKFVVLDYLQLVNPSKTTANRAYDVGTISTKLKQLAQQLGICVLAISQLNRGVEQRVDKRPLLSDLRESGSLEQDADAVLMLYRDEYYDETSDAKGQAELICRKNRHGPMGTVHLAFVADRVRFADLAPDMPSITPFSSSASPKGRKSSTRQEL